jgi:hypothetical protein
MERKSQPVRNNIHVCALLDGERSSSMLGNWEAAYKDFCKAQISDFDEDVQTWCKEVAENVRCSAFEIHIVDLNYRSVHLGEEGH